MLKTKLRYGVKDRNQLVIEPKKESENSTKTNV